MKELEQCRQRKRKGELQNTEDRTEKPTDKAIFRMCDEIMEFQRREICDLMYLKTKT
jgi:hypothetical protein